MLGMSKIFGRKFSAQSGLKSKFIGPGSMSVSISARYPIKGEDRDFHGFRVLGTHDGLQISRSILKGHWSS